MSSKGIDFYSTIHVPGIRTRLRINHSSGGEVTFTGARGPHEHGHLEVDSDGLGAFESSKEVFLEVFSGDRELLSRKQLVDTRWPKFHDGDLSDVFASRSFHADTPSGPVVVSYGFGDTSGLDGMSDVAYATVTRPHRRWMGDLLDAHPSVKFSELVLPGAHNAGMYEPDAAWLRAEFVDLAMRTLPEWTHRTIENLPTDEAFRLVINSAYTQKDDLCTMLDMGIRYFDLRPGVVPGTSTVRHVHTAVPGQSLEDLARKLLGWLTDNPTEIAVLRLADSGIIPECLPPASASSEILSNALADYKIQIATAAELNRSVQDLLDTNTQLFLLGNDLCYGSWNDSYRTTDPEKIKEALAELTPHGQQRRNHTVLELQSSGSDKGLAYGAKNWAASEFIRLRPRFSHTLHPWVRENVATQLPTGLLVLSDDFVDGSLTQLAIDVTTSRLKSA